MVPASSSYELLSHLVRFCSDMTWCWMAGGNGSCQKMLWGWSSVSAIPTPPPIIPSLDASEDPRVVGGRWTSSDKFVGQSMRQSMRSIHSCRQQQMLSLSFIRPLSATFRPYCSTKNKLLPPDMPGTMLCNSPSSCCHRCWGTSLWGGKNC